MNVVFFELHIEVLHNLPNLKSDHYYILFYITNTIHMNNLHMSYDYIYLFFQYNIYILDKFEHFVNLKIFINFNFTFFISMPIFKTIKTKIMSFKTRYIFIFFIFISITFTIWKRT